MEGGLLLPVRSYICDSVLKMLGSILRGYQIYIDSISQINWSGLSESNFNISFKALIIDQRNKNNGKNLKKAQSVSHKLV